MKLTSKELSVLSKLFRDFDTYKLLEISRRSEKEFDLNISGEAKYGVNWCNFSAWLPLAFIRDCNWLKYAEMTDYLEMVRDGDWSGMRDSSPDKIWEIFKLACRDNGLFID